MIHSLHKPQPSFMCMICISRINTKIFERLIKEINIERLFEQTKTLCNIVAQQGKHNKSDFVILDYFCRTWQNGTQGAHGTLWCTW